MEEKVEFEGYWWIPENRENKHFGKLIKENNEYHLHLYGSFHDNPMNESDLNVIHGESSNGKEISLMGNIYRSTHGSIPGIPQKKYKTRLVFIGKLYNSLNEIAFNKYVVRYTYLTEWINISGFKVEYNPKATEFNITYKHPEIIESKPITDFILIIDFDLQGPTFPILNNVIISQGCAFIFKFEEEKDIKSFFSLNSLIEDFLSLAIGQPIFQKSIEGFSPDNVRKIHDTEINDPVQIILPSKSTENTSEKTIDIRDMVFQYKSIRDNIEIFLRHWIEKSKELKLIYNLYFHIVYKSGISIDNKLNILLKIIEIYHRKFINNKEMDEKEYKKMIKEIQEALPEKYLDWFNRKISFIGNQPSLSIRLHDILEKYSFITDELIEDRNDFVNKAKRIRNYFTHFTGNEKDEPDVIDIVQITRKLNIIVESIFLREIGFDDDMNKKIVMRQWNLKYNRDFTIYGPLPEDG